MIKKNEKAADCFLKVKKHYLKFLNKEKILDQSVATKIENLRRIYIPVSFWIDNKYKKKGSLTHPTSLIWVLWVNTGFRTSNARSEAALYKGDTWVATWKSDTESPLTKILIFTSPPSTWVYRTFKIKSTHTRC